MGDIVKEVVGTSYALIVGLADGQQITFQSGFADDETDTAINARMDRLVRLAFRQRAIAELPKLREDLVRLERQRSQTAADKDKLDAEFESGLDDRAIRIRDMAAELEEVKSDAYAEFTTSGRRGEFKPVGKTKSKIDGLLRDIFNLTQERESEKKQATSQHPAFLRQMDLEITHLEAKIADLEKVT